MLHFTFPELSIYINFLLLSLLYFVAIRKCPCVITNLIETP